MSLKVRDFGEGVPDEDLESIFKPFYRVAHARKRAGGCGLGLSITNEAIRFHGGQVKAINCIGGGLLVEAKLPLYENGKPAEGEALTHKELVE